MNYIIYYEIASLVLIFAIALKYFSSRQFHIFSNTMFSHLLIFNVLYIVFDIIGADSINKISIVKPWIVFSSNFIYYVLQIVLIFLIMLYFISLSTDSRTIFKKFWWTFIPGLICLVLFIINIFTRDIFSIEIINGKPVYQSTVAAYMCYAHSAYCIIFSNIYSFLNKKKLTSKQIKGIVSYSCVIGIIVIIQFILPKYLLTGSAFTLGILMISYNMQDPESMLDARSGVFNLTALDILLNKTSLRRNEKFYFIAVDISDIEKLGNIFGYNEETELLTQFGSFLNNSLNIDEYAFRINNVRFLIVVRKEARYLELISILNERFKQYWNLNGGLILLKANIRYYIESNKNHFKDILGILNASLENLGQYNDEICKAADPGLLKDTNRQFEIEADLRRILKENSDELYLELQPIYDVKTGIFKSCEALIRMNSNTLGKITPSEFVIVAEATGLIYQLDICIFEKICKFLNENDGLYSKGFELIHFNLSGCEKFSAVKKDIRNIINKYQINPERICIEITETATIRNELEVINFIKEFSILGFKFAMDDFGTGYSNFNSLTKFPFNIIKLDRLFVPDNTDSKEYSVLSDTVNMLKHLNKRVLIEGCETANQIDIVKQSGIDDIQGYYYSSPLSEKEFIEFIYEKN